MPGRQFDGSSLKYLYGFNGKENEDYGNRNSYDFGARIFDSRISRWLSVDPLASKFPNETPYSFAACNPIRLIDQDGQAPTDPPFWIWFRETTIYGNRMMTNGAFQRAAEVFGVPSTSPYLPRLGRIFEDAVLRSAQKTGMKKAIYPYPVTSPNTYFIPDAIQEHGHKIIDGSKGTTTTYNFSDAIITDAKFTTEGKISLTDQITGFIDYLSEHRGVSVNGVATGEKNSDYGMASLIFATPTNVAVGQDVIDYAKSKNVNLYQRVAIQVTSFGQTYSGSQSEQQAIKNNELKISEAFPVFIAPSKNKKIDRSNVSAAGGHGNGNSVNINWSQQ
jgi:RHS repeat-associated protein